jgi:hypothetical protein
LDHPALELRTCALAIIASSLSPCLRLRARSSPAPSALTLASRCRRPQPRVATRWVPRHQLRPSSPHPEGLLDRPRASELNSLWLCRPSTSRVPCSMAPPVALLLGLGRSRIPLASPGPLLRVAHQRVTLPRPEAPCTDRSHRSAPRLRLELCCAGRHWCPGFATEGPASDMLSRALFGSLDLRTYRLFAGALTPHVARRLLQLKRSPSTPSSRPIPRPPATASRRSVRVAIPLRGLPAELSQARGFRTNPMSPHRDDRSSQRFYPDLFDSDTSCR